MLKEDYHIHTKYSPDCNLEVSAVIEEIKKQGGRLLIPHPFDALRKSRLKIPLEKLVDDADFIEVYNGRNFFNSANRKAADFANKHGITSVVGSDAHFGFEIGNAEESLFNWRGRLGSIFTKLIKIFRRLL